MSSSISNSEPGVPVPHAKPSGAAWKITVLLVAVFIVLEFFTRAFLFPRSKDFVRFGAADAVDVLQRNHDALVGGKIDPRDTSHVSYSLRRKDHGKSVVLGRFPWVPMST